MKIVQIKKEEIQKASLVLTEAFSEDPIFMYIFKGKEKYLKQSPWLFATWIKWAMKFGCAWMTEDGNAVILLRAPGKSEMSFISMVRAGMLPTPFKIGFGTFRRFYFGIVKTLDQKHEEVMGTRPHWYGWMVGTKLSHRGHGRILINHCSRLADEYGLPIFLETASKRNVRLYGFKNCIVADKLFFSDGGFSLYFLVREAKKYLHSM